MLLSICLPTYNRREQAERQLNFLLEDAEPFLGVDVEILVSNNASPDGTDDAIKDIRAKNDKFQYFLQEENIGGARNIAFLAKKANGKYIWVTGDDDAIRPGTIGRVVEILKEYSDIDLGALFLSNHSEYPKENYRAGVVRWENLKLRNTTFAGDLIPESCYGLQIYDQHNTQLYDYSGQYGDFIFVTRCVLRRESYVKVTSSARYISLSTNPFACCLLSIKDSRFFVDSKISIYQGLSTEDSWSHLRGAVFSIDLMNCFLFLSELGFSQKEINPIIKVFLRTAILWSPPFHPKTFDVEVIRKFVKLIIRNGYFIPFAQGLTSCVVQFIKHRLNGEYAKYLEISEGNK